MYEYDYEIVCIFMFTYAKIIEIQGYISHGRIIMLDEVRSKKAVVGMRRSMKLIESGMAEKAFVAGNVEPNMTRQIVEACRRNSVPIELISSKEELGKACRIDVDASIVVLPK